MPNCGLDSDAMTAFGRVARAGLPALIGLDLSKNKSITGTLFHFGSVHITALYVHTYVHNSGLFDSIGKLENLKELNLKACTKLTGKNTCI